MLLLVNGKIARSLGRFMTITPDAEIILKFRVKGSYFPARYNSTFENSFRLISQNNIDNKLYIDYNDGTGEHVVDFKVSGSNRRIDMGAVANATTPATINITGSFVVPVYYFQDLPAGIKNTVNDSYEQYRDITMRFQKPQAITTIIFNRTYLYNSLPAGLSKLQNLEYLSISQSYFITNFPQDFYNSRIRTLNLSQVGDVMNAGFPNWILNSPIQTLSLTNTINLSGSAENKRFDEINKLKETLTYINIAQTGINYTMPAEFAELYKLKDMYIGINSSTAMRLPDDVSGLQSLEYADINRTAMPFTEFEKLLTLPSVKVINVRNAGHNNNYDIAFTNTTLEHIQIGGQTWNAGAVPAFVSKLTGLKILALYQANFTISNHLNAWGDFSACINLTTINITAVNTMATALPVWLNQLTKLKSFIAPAAYGTVARVNAFVDSFYSFTVANAPITGTSASQFRSMTVDIYGSTSTETSNSVRPSGNYQQPAGYIQGSNNGTPASQLEKIWVLVNQYEHVWNIKPL
jgi:hypothetical protein